MKVDTIYNLIKSHYKSDENQFRKLALEVADYLIKNNAENTGYNLISYIDNEAKMDYQNYPKQKRFKYIRDVDVVSNNSIYMPKAIQKNLDDIFRLIIRKNNEIQKFLFYGLPGTGKTVSVKLLAQKLNIPLYVVSSHDLVNSLLGETSKNINSFIDEVMELDKMGKPAILLVDEIDSIALDRINSTDHREMGRATTTFFNLLEVNFNSIYIIATTNLYKNMDKALLRRFDWTLSFDSYKDTDFKDIFIKMALDKYSYEDSIKKDLVAKIYKNHIVHSPAEISQAIKISNATSRTAKQYLKSLFRFMHGKEPTIKKLKALGMTVRDMEKILNKSRSTISKELRN